MCVSSKFFLFARFGILDTHFLRFEHSRLYSWYVKLKRVEESCVSWNCEKFLFSEMWKFLSPSNSNLFPPSSLSLFRFSWHFCCLPSPARTRSQDSQPLSTQCIWPTMPGFSRLWRKVTTIGRQRRASESEENVKIFKTDQAVACYY